MELMVEECKQTEIGLIPVDWEVKPIGSFVSISVGRDLKEDNFSSYHDEKYCYPVYSNTVSNFGLYGFYNIAEYSGESLTIVGRGVGLGKAFQRTGGYGAIGRLLVIFPEKNVDANFLTEYINHKITIFSESGGIPQLTGLSIAKYRVPLPPTKAEQTAIATALSDADALISSLDKLIAKKRNIKQGAMQKLLEPKEGWEVKTLKQLAKYRRGSFPQPYGLDKWYDDTSGMPFVQVFDVDDNFILKNETKRKISKEAQDMSVFIEKGSIIITLQGSIGRIAITQYDAFVDRTLLFFESFLIPFDKYFFLLMIFQLFEKEKEKAPGGIIKTITKEALSSFTIAYPDIDEQRRISTVLSDINSEITMLETKLKKYRNVKLGMMQNLLTGKIRLVNGN